MNLWPPSIRPFIMPSIYKRWPGQAQCGSQPAWDGDTHRYHRRSASPQGRKRPQGPGRRVKCAASSIHRVAARHTWTDGAGQTDRPADCARLVLGAGHSDAQPRIAEKTLPAKGGAQDRGAGRGRRGRDRTDENPAEVRRGAVPPSRAGPEAAPPQLAGVWAPAQLGSVCTRPRVGAGSGCPGEGTGEGVPRRAGTQEVGRGQEWAQAAGPPDSDARSDFGFSLPGGESTTSSFPAWTSSPSQPGLA